MKKNFNEFIKDVMAELGTKLENGCTVCCQELRKNNGTVRQALMITSPAHNASPCYSMENYYALYENPEDIKIIADNILKIYRCEDMLDYPAAWVLDKANVQNSVLFRIVNTDKNAGLLADMPHYDIPDLDLSMLFYLPIAQGNEDFASMLVGKKHMDICGISETELLEHAWTNTLPEMGYTITSLPDILTGLFQGSAELPEYVSVAVPMLVITNKHKFYGAGCILYPEVLEAAAKKHGSDFYILPSSIHEVITIPADCFDIREAGKLKTMVMEINQSELSPEEQLSDSVYYYSQKQRRLFLGI